jgi:DNA helicase-2/ATP-dependent DNA helicase PcrA
MTWPGPIELGRGVVVRAGDTVPPAWSTAPLVRIDDSDLRDEDQLERLVEDLHRSWVNRTPVVVEWDAADDALAEAETTSDPPWQLRASFLFPLERLRFLCFSNNYDARNGEPKWWWTVKAGRIGATPGGRGDAHLPNGEPVWIDGGPRQPLDPLDLAVIHGETIDAGSTTLVGPSADPGDDRLAPDQAAAVRHPTGGARIIAPAGSGKTRTLAARLRHLRDDRRIEPRYLTAVAYNARAAAELRQRLAAEPSMVRTIHSLGWAILGEARPGLDLVDELAVRNLLGGLISVPRRANADPLGPYLEALEQVRSGLMDPERVEHGRDDVPGFASVFEDYRTRLYDARSVDHGEQVYGAIEALLTDPDLRSRWQHRCRHLLVDEFQDLTPAYLLLLRLVASPQLQVFGVGDDDQVIYGYAGADPGFLIDFDRYFPGAGHHALEVNYRCPQPIVTAAGHLLSYNRRRIDKTIRAAADDGDPGALLVRELPGPDLATECRSQIEQWIAAGVAPRSIAVLARVNASLIPVKAALSDVGIPSNDLLNAQSLRRTTLRALFAWLRIAQQPERIERNDALEAIRRPSRGLTGLSRELVRRRITSLEELIAIGTQLEGKQAARWLEFVDDVTLAAEAAAAGDAATLLGLLIDRIGLGSSARTLDAGRGNASRSSHLDDLVAVQRAAAIHPTLEDFVPWLRAATDRPATEDGVTLSSVHRVKGMEWERVVVFGADRGAMPHDLAADVEEERRVFHVALTRAREQAVVLVDAARPSPFLTELDGSASHEPPPPPRPRRWSKPPRLKPVPLVGDQVKVAGGLAGVVSKVGRGLATVVLDTGAELEVPLAEVTVATSARPASSALVDALKAWRLGASQRLGVPAYVILHDRTIEEIAAVRPETERALISISGIGARKLEDYGDDILGIVASHQD